MNGRARAATAGSTTGLGGCGCTRRDGGSTTAVAAADALASLGVTSRTSSTAAEVSDLVPAVRPGSVVGAVMSVDDGAMDPAAFTRATVATRSAAGARVVTGAEAYGFDVAGDEARRRAHDAPASSTRSRSCWPPAPGVAGPRAASSVCALPIEPAKGYSVDVDRPEGLPDMPLCVAEPHVVLTPLGDAVRLGSTLELSGWDMRIASQARRSDCGVPRSGARLARRTGRSAGCGAGPVR